MVSLGDRVSDPRGSGLTLLAGVLYLLAGSLVAVWQGPSLLVLHAFAAFITLSIVAASNQLVPVLTNAPPFPPSVTLIQALPLALGFLLLLLGFAGAPTFIAAAVLLALGAIAWATITTWRVATAPLEGQTRAAIGAAAATFGVAAFLGAMMALALGDRMKENVLGVAPSHGFLMIIGFATMMVVTVSFRFVPMFSLAHTKENRFTRVGQWMLLGAAWLAALSTPSATLRTIALAVALFALVGAAGVHLRSLRVRLRKKLDVSLRYAAVAWSCAIGAAVLCIAAGWRPSLWPSAIAVAVAGWLSISILGYSYKIMGFLAWEYGRRRSPAATLPPLSDAVPPRPANGSLALLAIGVVAIAVSEAIPSAAAESRNIHLDFLVYALGAFSTAGLLARLIRSYVVPSSRNDQGSHTPGSGASASLASGS